MRPVEPLAPLPTIVSCRATNVVAAASGDIPMPTSGSGPGTVSMSGVVDWPGEAAR